MTFKQIKHHILAQTNNDADDLADVLPHMEELLSSVTACGASWGLTPVSMCSGNSTAAGRSTAGRSWRTATAS